MRKQWGAGEPKNKTTVKKSDKWLVFGTFLLPLASNFLTCWIMSGCTCKICNIFALRTESMPRSQLYEKKMFQECWRGMYAEHPDHFGSSQRSVSKQQTRPEGCHKEPFLKSSVINSLSLSSVTNVFTRKRLYSLQTFFFTQKNLSSKMPLRRIFYTNRNFYTEKFLHKKTFTHRNFRSQNISHRAVSTHKCLYT